MSQLVNKIEDKLKNDSMELVKEIGKQELTFEELMETETTDVTTPIEIVILIAKSSKNKELKNMARVVLHEVAKIPPKEEFIKKSEVIDNINSNND